MTQYIVTREPKATYRSGLVISVMVVEAKTAKEALARFVETDPNEPKYFNMPKVQQLELGHTYRL